MAWPSAFFRLSKEIARHLLRRPVVGILALARTEDGRYVLIRRGDSGEWALPGGTLDWGEELRSAVGRELMEEAGARVLGLGRLLGAYSAPSRDPRFHAVTLLVEATVKAPEQLPENELEISEVGLFKEGELPKKLSHGQTDMLQRALRGELYWE